MAEEDFFIYRFYGPLRNKARVQVGATGVDNEFEWSKSLMSSTCFTCSASNALHGFNVECATWFQYRRTIIFV